MDLDLRATDAPPSPEKLRDGVTVRLHSERLDCDLDLEITHRTPQPGGTVRNEPPTPFLDAGDHVHFEWNNVLAVLD